MTIEMLKQEADKLGYRLAKKKSAVRFVPCTCGANRRERWHSVKPAVPGVFFRCSQCGKESPLAKTRNDAINEWNDMIYREITLRYGKTIRGIERNENE